MDLSDGSLMKILVAVSSVTYSVIFGLVARRVWGIAEIVDLRLQAHEEKFKERLDRIDEEGKMAHRRITVHDRISSKLIEQDFDSRAIAESGIYPRKEQ
jgi:hypothetical protein